MAARINPTAFPNLNDALSGPPYLGHGGERMLGVPVNPGPDGRATVFAAGQSFGGLGLGAGLGTGPNGGSMTTSVSGVTMGFETNETLNYAWPLRPYKNGWEKHIARGDVLFIRRRLHPDSNLVTAANLQQVNYFLELDNMFDEGRAPVTPHVDGPAAQFTEDWNFVGIVQALDADRKRSVRSTSVSMVQASTAGMQYMPNAFGNNVRIGTKLWGIVRPVTFASDKMIGPTGTSLGSVRVRTRSVLQVELFGDYHYDTVPADRLEYTTEDGLKRMSHVFFIGTAQENAQTVTPMDLAAAMRDATRYASLPTFQVCVAH